MYIIWIWSQDRDNVELAKRVLAWLSCAQRPMTVLGIQHALAVVPGSTNIDKDALIDEGLLLSVCAGLVSIETLRFAHHTYQEYVERTLMHWFPTAQIEIATTCLTYLSFDVFAEDYHGSVQETENQVQEYPLFRYAARFWGNHVRGEPERILKELVLKFLEQESNLSSSIQLLPELEREKHSRRARKPVTQLWVAAYFGLEVICRLLLANGANVEAKTGSGETALYRAVTNRHEAVTRLLLENGADVNAQGGFYSNALQAASACGHDTVVRLLLEKGADINAQGGLYSNALQAASVRGCDTAVRLLLENRASVNDEQKTSLPLLLKGRSEIKRDESGTIQLLLEQSKKHDMAISAAETAEINITNYRSSAADSKCDVDTDKWVQTYSNHDEARAATHGSLKAASTESLSSTSS